MRKTAEPITMEERITLTCFAGVKGKLSCYDEEIGNYIEFKKNWDCQKNTCYELESKELMEGKAETTIVNLNSASIEDLRNVIKIEQLLNEELRYNFGLILGELAEMREVAVTMMLSLARLDHNLIGSIVQQPVMSKFINKKEFYLTGCTEEEETYNDTSRLNTTWKIDPFKKQELWFPEIQEQAEIGTVENFEGWTYINNEQINLRETLEWATNVQKTTSLADLAELPKGFINNTMMGFATLHTMTIIAAITVIVYLYCNRSDKKGKEAVMQTIINMPQHISRNEEESMMWKKQVASF